MNLFFEFLQVAIGIRNGLSHIPTDSEWQQILDISLKQSLAGLVFAGIERLPQEEWPPNSIKLEWIGIVTDIENMNILTTSVCCQLCRKLEKDGFKICVLKGQANYAYYPSYLLNRRSCGDIDIWVTPNGNGKHPVEKTLKYLEKEYGLTGLCWLHANISDKSGVPVEVHLRPSFMNAPISNKRFLKCFEEIDDCVCQKKIEGGITLPAMKPEYDVIYQMNHIYRHLIDEGVGLRQIVDYYFLLMSDGGGDKDGVKHTIEYLGMKRFASALMWVLHTVFAMPHEKMLYEPSEKDGRFLLDEIMMAGNFGHSDSRMTALKVEEGKLSYQVNKALRRIKRNMRFFRSYPSEVFFEPYSRIWHFAWKKGKMWKF